MSFKQNDLSYSAAAALKVRQKDLLGYHDVRTGNLPDARLIKFIGTNLMAVAQEAREKFDEYKDILSPFASREMGYAEFAARIRRRTNGQKEDNDWPEREDDERL